MGTVLSSDDVARVVSFAVVFTAMALWEVVAGRRRLRVGRGVRWPNNVTMLVLGVGVVRVLMPLTVVEVAGLASAREWGLLGQLSRFPAAATFLAVVGLDLALYAQHLAFHHVPLLWRVHRVHHADPDFDVTTGLRFHPFEFIVSAVVKVGAVVAIGAPPVAVVIFEILLNLSSMVTHGNVSLPASLDRAARWVLVTPDMHRIHHSVAPAEHNTNFGFHLAVWDRLFRTYRREPAAGHDAMTIGLGVGDSRATSLSSSLRFPFDRDG